jgi:hypothetical protein
MDKHTKIAIPEIPGEWTDRTRSGHTNIWNYACHGTPNRNGLPEVRLSPPESGLYAERIDGAWYWVSGCSRCNERGERWSYVVCDKHNVCISCATPRADLVEAPWGHPDGFICKPCHDKEKASAKATALAKAAENEHDESNCSYCDQIICPVCASVMSSDDMHERETGLKCDVCDSLFDLEIEYTASYTTTIHKASQP